MEGSDHRSSGLFLRDMDSKFLKELKAMKVDPSKLSAIHCDLNQARGGTGIHSSLKQLGPMDDVIRCLERIKEILS